MRCNFWIYLLYFVRIICSQVNNLDSSKSLSWLINHPEAFHEGNSLGTLADDTNMIEFENNIDDFLSRTVGSITDGEVVDAMEHFFWGKRNGLAIELGALDGSEETQSMTYAYEKSFNWKRIIIEGNPTFRDEMLTKSPLAFSVNAAICTQRSKVHFKKDKYVGGIVEFMSEDFIKKWHPRIYDSCVPPGNLTSLNYSSISHLVTEVECMPLTRVLRKARVKHVNYFVLDVEGGELAVLKSIKWKRIKFDVICIETDPKTRPIGYSTEITAYLSQRGYMNATAQQGRNTWYTNNNFIPSSRPGIDPQCYNGLHKSKIAENAIYKRCPMTT